jgi:hypothetical protein
MATDSPVVPKADWPPRLEAIAEAYDCAETLPRIWELTLRIFPGHRIEVLVEDDPEIADLQFVVFEVTVNGWVAQQMIEARDRWTQGLYECCPHTNPFVLGFRSGE